MTTIETQLYKVWMYQAGKNSIEISCELTKEKAMDAAGTLNESHECDGLTSFFFIERI